jgi:DNA (cytosine-5)-methyltransferase 1
MVRRERKTEAHGFCRGLDEANLAEAQAAGDAIVTQIASWIAEKLNLEEF